MGKMSNTRDWEKEFDEKFVRVRNWEPSDDEFANEKYLPRKVKAFIKELLRQEREKVIDALEKDIEPFSLLWNGENTEDNQMFAANLTVRLRARFTKPILNTDREDRHVANN